MSGVTRREIRDLEKNMINHRMFYPRIYRLASYFIICVFMFIIGIIYMFNS